MLKETRMKRILAGLTLASCAALMAATPAQAAPVNPVKALKKQYVAGHGVRVSETSRTTMNGKTGQVRTTTGALGFGKSGVVAADLRFREKGGVSGLSPSRSITVGKHTYVQGGIYSEGLPEGKKWIRYADPSVIHTSQPLDVFDSKVLKALVSKAKSAKGGTYRGSLTFADVSKLYGEKIDKRLGKIKINYALDLNSKGLITGVRSEYTMDFGVLGSTTATVNTRFTGWGAKITIKAPPSDQVVDHSELGADTEVPQEIPNGSLDSLGKVQ
jgi:opacity protein-like surface antigen